MDGGMSAQMFGFWSQEKMTQIKRCIKNAGLSHGILLSQRKN
jgi:hypothetical protein